MPHPKGGYKVDGKKVPGVTTITGRFKESGGLLFWAFEQGKAAERGEISRLYDKRNEAADAGTLAHAMVEAHIYEKNINKVIADALPEIRNLAEQGFNNYLAWQKNNRIEVIYQEIELVSSKHKYGGCPDGIGVDANGRWCLIDWKTSSGIYTDYLIQLAAYKNLWEENNPSQLITGGFHLCRFSKEHADFSHHYWSELDDAWEQFKLLRVAYDIDKRLKKRAK